jgi:hypothetical protein
MIRVCGCPRNSRISGSADVFVSWIVPFLNGASLDQLIDDPMDRRAQAAALEPVKFRPLRHVPDQGRRRLPALVGQPSIHGPSSPGVIVWYSAGEVGTPVHEVFAQALSGLAKLPGQP